MHENDFEKQIKDMMEGYKLSPSASVWEKVKQRISKRKRRVWPFAILLVCVLTGGYVMYNSAVSTNTDVTTSERTLAKKDKNVPSTKPGGLIDKKDKTAATENSEKNKINNVSAGKKNVIAQTPLKHNDKNSFSLKANDNNFLSNNNLNKTGKNNLNKKELTKNDNQQRPNETLIAEKDIAIKDKPANDNVLQQLKVTDNNKVLQGSDIHANNDQSQTSSINNSNTIVPANKNTKPNENSNLMNTVDSTTKQQLRITKAVTKRKIKTDNKSSFKWQFGVTALYGGSNINKNIFQQHTSDGEKSLNSATTGSFSRMDTFSTSSHPFNYNDAFKAGITIQRRINKNMSINTGINYTQLSNRANVTRRLENIGNSPAAASDVTYSPQSYLTSSVSSNTTAEQTFTSVYSFIEIPVQWQQNFIHKNKLSFSYNAGFSVMHLLSSDALIYDQKKNIYFSDKNAFKSTQLQASLGLNMHVDLKKKYTLTIGPQLNYSLTKALKSNDYGKYHYFMYGLQAGIMMHK